MYQAQRPARSQWVPLRHHRYHLRVWGEASPDAVPLVLLHGWMDVGASFQFLVDALAAPRWVLAPDWRGFGLTEGPRTDAYWFPDYMADLDALLDALLPAVGATAVDLVGHSMGGNVAMMYAGARPERVRRLVNLEGFGLPSARPAQAPRRYARWMDELRALRQGQLALRDHDSAESVAQRLMKNNPRLTADKAQWLALHWARPDAQGRWRVLGADAHKVASAQLYRVDEALALYAAIQAPVLSVRASEDSLSTWWKGQYTLAEYSERLRSVPHCREAELPDCGHMLHHDQPQALAQLIEAFLA